MKNLKQGDALTIQALSSYKKDKLNKSSKPQNKQQSSLSQLNQRSKKDEKSVKFDTSSKSCWTCGGETRNPRSDCPANGKDCGKCGKPDTLRKCAASTRRIPPHPLRQDALDCGLLHQPNCRALEHCSSSEWIFLREKAVTQSAFSSYQTPERRSTVYQTI